MRRGDRAARSCLGVAGDSTLRRELLLLEVPLSAGTPFNVLMANKPGDIAMITNHASAKSSPATSRVVRMLVD